MNYIKQVNTFYRLLPNNPLSSNAQCLYSYLLNKDSEFGWVKRFKIANCIVMGFTGLSISGLQRARNELKQKGYIDYEKGLGNHAGIYEIIDFEEQIEQQIEQQNERQTDNKVSILNKLNKTKLNNLKKNNKKKYGEYGNVKLDDSEYEKMMDEFPNDYKTRIQILDDYIQSTGKQYKDHLATIRNWARRDGYRRPEKRVEYREINTENMTDEEYRKLLQEEKRYDDV